MKALLFSFWFYLLFALVSLIYTPSAGLVVIAGRLFSSSRVTMRRFRTAIRWYGRILIWGLPRPFLNIRYSDKAAVSPTPCIVVCNHRSSSDPFLMACLDFEVVQVVNTWPFRIPFLGWFARWAGYLSVNQMPYDEFHRRCVRLIREGVSIVAFPEGTRSGSRRLGQFRSAMFRIALEEKVPIVPLCIVGNENRPPRGSFRLHPGRIVIHKLPACEPRDYRGMNAFVLKNRIRALIGEETKKMDASYDTQNL